MSADLIERLRKRAKEDQTCADNSAVIVEALAEQMKRFDDCDEKRPWNTYAVRMAVDHRNSVRRDAQFAADLTEAADALAAKDAALSEMRAELERVKRALEPFAEEVDRVEKSYAEFNDGNRAPLLLDDDSRYLGNRIRWRHLRSAARALASQDEGEER